MAYDVSPVIIKYDNQQVFDSLPGNQPIPFVTRTQNTIRHGSYWGQVSNYNIDGQITGTGPELWSMKDSIIQGFKKDFAVFSISDGSEFVNTSGTVRNISFAESKYYGILDYSISIEAYDENLFSGTYGVLNPVDQISYTHSEDEKIEIVHQVSAKGFHAGTGSPLENARNFVLSRRDSWKSKAKPIFASGAVDFSEVSPILVSSDESIDRFEGTYSLSDTFVFSRTGLTAVIDKKSIVVESGITNEVITATINGEVYAGKEASLDVARTHIKDMDYYSVVSSKCPDGVNLYHIPTNIDINENPKTNTIDYSITYDNINIFDDSSLSGTSQGTRGAYFDHTVSIERDALTDVTTATIAGSVKGRGNAVHRRKNIQDFYENSMKEPSSGLSAYLYHQMGPVYSGIMGGGARVPNPYPTEISVSSGNANGEIQISASFSDKDYVEGFLSVDYSVEVDAAMPIKTINPSARFDENGYYILGDVDVGSREKVNIKVDMVYDREHYATNVIAGDNSDSLYSSNQELKSLLVDLASEYTPLNSQGAGADKTLTHSSESKKVRLDSETYNENRDSRSMSASYTYSFNGSNFPDTKSVDIYNEKDTFMRDQKSITWLSQKYFK